jgi:hypothetical protein
VGGDGDQSGAHRHLRACHPAIPMKRQIPFLLVLCLLQACGARGCSRAKQPMLSCLAHEHDDPTATCEYAARAGCDNFSNAARDFSYAAVYSDRESCLTIGKARCLSQLTWRGADITVGKVWAGAEQLQAVGAGKPAPELDPACIPKPMLAPNEPCVDDLQCKGGYCSRSRPGDGCGKCQLLRTEGSSCSLDARCNFHNNLHCESGSCRKRPGNGDHCEHDYDCVGGYCDSGTCRPEKGPGKECSDSEQCSWELRLVCQNGRCQNPVYAKLDDPCERVKTFCAPGLTCRTGKCTRVLAGADCSGPKAFCGPGQKCVNNRPYDGSGTCRESVGLGGPCSSQESPFTDCAVGLRCINKVCGVLDDSACASNPFAPGP